MLPVSVETFHHMAGRPDVVANEDVERDPTVPKGDSLLSLLPL